MNKLSITYQHGTLQTDISNLQTSEVEFLEINWSDTSSQEESTRCKEEISRFLESHRFPEVKRLVLNNLFCSRKLLEKLLEKFNNIEHLKILPFNSGYMIMYAANFKNFTNLSELEITLGPSDGILLAPPIQLKELTLSICTVASESLPYVSQCIYLDSCTSLESL